MAGLDYLFQGSEPSSVTSNVVSTSTLPDWYQEYLRGIAGKATSIAGEGYTPYPGARLADFNPDQLSAFNSVRQNQGSWNPMYSGALSALNGMLPGTYGALGMGAQYAGQGADQAMAYGSNAVGSVASPLGTWDQNYDKYLSPYTKNVVDEIGRLGNQNLMENVIPGVQSQFLGAGGFGSDRNAQILGQTVRDTQTNITGQQSSALQSGWNSANSAFNADQARRLQQMGLQSSTALGAGQMVSGALGAAGQMANSSAQIGAAAADTASQRYGGLAQLLQSLHANDAASLGAIGGAQQGLQQQGYDLGYNNFLEQRDWDRNNIGFLNSAVRGMPMPTGMTQTMNSPSGGYGSSPLAWLSALYGFGNSNRTTQPVATPGG